MKSHQSIPYPFRNTRTCNYVSSNEENPCNTTSNISYVIKDTRSKTLYNIQSLNITSNASYPGTLQAYVL